MKLLDSVLWVFKGTTQSNWTYTAPEAAQVVVVHHSEPAARVAKWRAEGKLIVVISTDASVAPAAPRTLLYPFPTVQVLSVLEQLDVELDAGAALLNKPADKTTSAAAVVDTDNSRGETWTFIESLRTLRAVSNAGMWLTARSSTGPLLWLQGDGKRYRCSPVTVNAIKAGKLRLSTLTLEKGNPPPEGLNQFPAAELTWFESYHASASVAPWLKENATYRLLQWPDFGRLRSHDPTQRAEQIRLLAVLENSPATLAQLAERARTSLELTTRTLNALAACGLVEVSSADTRKRDRALSAPRTPVGGLRQFLRSIRRHLGLGEPK